MFNIVIFGAPGSGKGTQSKMIARKYGFNHVSTGDLFREEIEKNTNLGQIANHYISKGRLVPDVVVNKMISNLLDGNVTSEGYIFDGFPRTLPQAQALEQILTDHKEQLDVVFSLEVDRQVLIDRLLKRRNIEGRNDDRIDIIEVRLKGYEAQASQLIPFYKERGKLVAIDGMGTVDEIFSAIETEIEKLIYVRK